MSIRIHRISFIVTNRDARARARSYQPTAFVSRVPVKLSTSAIALSDNKTRSHDHYEMSIGDVIQFVGRCAVRTKSYPPNGRLAIGDFCNAPQQTIQRNCQWLHCSDGHFNLLYHWAGMSAWRCVRNKSLAMIASHAVSDFPPALSILSSQPPFQDCGGSGLWGISTREPNTCHDVKKIFKCHESGKWTQFEVGPGELVEFIGFCTVDFNGPTEQTQGRLQIGNFCANPPCDYFHCSSGHFDKEKNWLGMAAFRCLPKEINASIA